MADTGPRPPRPYLGYAVAVLGAGLIATAPVVVASDGTHRLRALDGLLRAGAVDSVKYSLVGPLVAAPLWWLGGAAGWDVDRTVWASNRIAFLVFLAGLWVALRPALAEPERLRVVLVLLFGSMFPWHVQYFFGEVFQVACVGLGTALVAVRGGRWRWVGWPLAVAGTANVPATVVGLAVGVGVVCAARRRVRYALAAVAAVGLILAENRIRRGDWLAGGYDGDRGAPTALPFSGRPGFSHPLLFGLLAVLLSPGKGLLFFTPGLFLRPRPAGPAAPAIRLLYRVWVGIVVGLVLVYARWWAWYGGVAWGPRFFLFACLPAALVLAARTARPAARGVRANLLVLAALALSCWGGATGMVYREYGQERFLKDEYALEHMTWYVPECSVLWYPVFVDPKPLDWLDRARLGGFAAGFAYLAWPAAAAAATGLRARGRAAAAAAAGLRL